MTLLLTWTNCPTTETNPDQTNIPASGTLLKTYDIYIFALYVVKTRLLENKKERLEDRDRGLGKV